MATKVEIERKQRELDTKRLNTLFLTIASVDVEKLKMFPDSNPLRMAEDLKKAYDLEESKQPWEIYFFKESSMNKH